MSVSAMKQALEALEFFCEYGVIDRPFERIAELKQAIAEAEQMVPSDYPNSHQQEPFAVAWVLDGELFWPSEYEVIAQAGDKAIPLYAAPVHASDISQERVDETAKCGREWVEMQCPCGHKMYVKHTGREWVGLTKDEVDSWQLPVVPTVFQFAQFVEAKLKEKNS